MRQRSVQLRLKALDSFACSLGVDDRDAQELSLRGPSCSPTRDSQIVLGTTLLVLRF